MKKSSESTRKSQKRNWLSKFRDMRGRPSPSSLNENDDDEEVEDRANKFLNNTDITEMQRWNIPFSSAKDALFKKFKDLAPKVQKKLAKDGFRIINDEIEAHPHQKALVENYKGHKTALEMVLRHADRYDLIKMYKNYSPSNPALKRGSRLEKALKEEARERKAAAESARG